MNKSKLRKLQIILLPSIVLIAFAIIFLQFLYTLKKDISNLTYEDLQNTSVQQSEIISVKLDGQYEMLNSISNHIKNNYDEHDLTQTAALLKDFSVNSGFTFLGISSLSGYTVTSDGQSFDISHHKYFQSTIDGKNAIEKMNGDEILSDDSIVLSVPVYSLDGATVIAVLTGGMSECDFYALLYSSDYDENTYSFVVDNNGYIIIPSQNPNFLHTTNNIFDIYKESENHQSALDEFTRKIESDTSDVLYLEIADSDRYVFYTSFQDSITNLPSGAENWYLFTSVSTEAVDIKNNFLPQTVSVLTIELFFVAAFCFGYVFYLEYRKNMSIEQETQVLRENEEMYRVINDFSDNIIFLYDHSTQKLNFNNKYEKLFKHKPFTESAENHNGVNPYINKYDYSAYAKFINEIAEGLPKAAAEFRLLRPDGLFDWYKADITTLFDNDGKPTKSIGRLANVQEHHTKIEELTLRAETDSLTRILNHFAMKEKINRYLAESGKGSTHAFLYIDIDNFKAVNDTFGHLLGDEILVNIAMKMRQIFRETDFVGRLGGDEFAIFVKDMHYEAMIHKKTQNLLDAICQIVLPDKEIKLSCSIGISIYSKHGKTFEKLYKNADKALYKAKSIKNTYIIYSANDADMQIGAHDPAPVADDQPDDKIQL